LLRPHSRAVQRLAVAEFLSEASQLALAGGCATGLRTRWRHVRNLCSASLPFSSGSATACGSALARGHGSDLLPLRLPWAYEPAAPFVAPPAFWKLPGLASTCALPVANAHFVSPFGAFRLAEGLRRPPESPAPCWLSVATGYPLGNCDSRRLETYLRYLTRLGSVSHRSSPLSSYLALLTARERRQRNW
jgi:hypothetical protein